MPLILEKFQSENEFAVRVAARFFDFVRSKSGSCFVALSGGRSARIFFQAAAALACAQEQDLSEVHFFWADERCVPPDDSESNYAMASRRLFEPSQIASDHVHRIMGELGPEAASRAEAELIACVASDKAGAPVLDLVLLGMGEDGHVASLFPGNDLMIESRQSYHAVIGPKPPPQRITLAMSALIRARNAWVLISGPGKQAALQASLSRDGQTPLARLLQNRSSTSLFVALE